MKKLLYLLITLLSISLVSSCLVKDEENIDLNKSTSNLAGFEDSRKTLAAVADGKEYIFPIKMKVFGPTAQDITSDVVVTVAADPASTAKEGIHYKINNPTITLKPGDNLLGLLNVTMLTKGIETPLDESPVLILKATQVSGAANVVNSGKPITLVLNYACPSFLAGDYKVNVVRTDLASGATYQYNFEESIREIGVGTYRTSSAGHYTTGLGVGTEGFTFTDVCDVITVPEQNLNDYYSNILVGTQKGSVNGDVITIFYKITFAAGDRTYVATYTRK